jgi:7-cyano-7-deazaguanine reductase
MSKKFPRNWGFRKKIEEMPPKELFKKMACTMKLNLKKTIRTIPYERGKIHVCYSTNELVAICPATGYPDFYSIRITYEPKKLLPELKSLKMYFACYKDLPITHEHLADKIYADFNAIVKPRRLHLFMDVSIRGGIKTIIQKGEILLPA